MQTIDEKVISMVYGRGRGIVFTPKLFSGVGDPRSVGMNGTIYLSVEVDVPGAGTTRIITRCPLSNGPTTFTRMTVSACSNPLGTVSISN